MAGRFMNRHRLPSSNPASHVSCRFCQVESEFIDDGRPVPGFRTFLFLAIIFNGPEALDGDRPDLAIQENVDTHAD